MPLKSSDIEKRNKIASGGFLYRFQLEEFKVQERYNNQNYKGKKTQFQPQYNDFNFQCLDFLFQIAIISGSISPAQKLNQILLYPPIEQKFEQCLKLATYLLYKQKIIDSLGNITQKGNQISKFCLPIRYSLLIYVAQTQYPQQCQEITGIISILVVQDIYRHSFFQDFNLPLKSKIESYFQSISDLTKHQLTNAKKVKQQIEQRANMIQLSRNQKQFKCKGHLSLQKAFQNGRKLVTINSVNRAMLNINQIFDTISSRYGVSNMFTQAIGFYYDFLKSKQLFQQGKIKERFMQTSFIDVNEQDDDQDAFLQCLIKGMPWNVFWLNQKGQFVGLYGKMLKQTKEQFQMSDQRDIRGIICDKVMFIGSGSQLNDTVTLF